MSETFVRLIFPSSNFQIATLVTNNFCGFPNSISPLFSLTGTTVIQLSGGGPKKKISLPSARHTAALPPSGEICVFAPNPGNGVT